MIEHNCILGFINHLSTWTMSVWLICDILARSFSSFSLIFSRCLAISIWPSVPMLLSLSRLNKLSSIKLKVSSQEFLTSLVCSFLSHMFRSHAFSKMLPLVYSGMEILELLPISFFVVAMTASWKTTQAAPASLSLKEMSSST
jgi:hypothetical protein